jgi:hypothetical protein
MREMKPRLRGLPSEEAERQLVVALREHALFLPPGPVKSLARSTADPWRWVKHPFKTARSERASTRQAENESQRCEAETEEVGRKIQLVLDREGEGVRVHEYSFAARRTYDGMEYEIRLRPYSRPLAERIRHAVAPVNVTIKPAT